MMLTNTTNRHKIVIIGGGFGGLYAARRLGRTDADITLIDKRNFHLFQPLLYQVATGGISPADICSPLRSVLSRQKNTRVLLAEVTGIDLDRRLVKMVEFSLAYDTLIVAAGATSTYFGHDRWAERAPGMKSIEDALTVRRRILLAFETAEKESDPAVIARLLTFVVVGGGPTGVELAGALGEIANYTLRNDFRNINPGQASVILVEGSDRVLPSFPDNLPEKARQALNGLSVDVRTGVHVTEITDNSVTLKYSDGRTETIDTDTVIWAAGVKPSPLGAVLAGDDPSRLDRSGRVIVNPDLTLPGHPEVLVIGDLAHFAHQDGQPLPGLAPVAMQQGKYAARLISDRLAGRTTPSFRYLDKGNLATIGRNRAVGHIWKINFSGFLAWLTWLFVHLMYIVEYGNRLLIFFQWAWNYFSWSRGARLITDELTPAASAGPGRTPRPEPTHHHRTN